MRKNAKNPSKDTLWPPLGVRDLPPEVPARREVVRINTIADKLAEALGAWGAESGPLKEDIQGTP